MANVSVTFQIDAADAPDVLAAHCERFGYQAVVPDPATPGGHIPNPESALAFSKRKIIEEWSQMTVNYRVRRAQRAAAGGAPVIG